MISPDFAAVSRVFAVLYYELQNARTEVWGSGNQDEKILQPHEEGGRGSPGTHGWDCAVKGDTSTNNICFCAGFENTHIVPLLKYHEEKLCTSGYMNHLMITPQKYCDS